MTVGDAGTQRAWTNSSVLQFAAGADPMNAATAAAGTLLESARAAGMTAPPIDVIELAKLLGLEMQPANTVTDAAISAAEDTSPVEAPLRGLLPSAARLTITYNPSRPRGRLRFSIAHEIAHALFADVAAATRQRTTTGALPDTGDDGWELELLCNVIASELLLPDDAVVGLLDIDTNIDFIMETRRRWDVSTEALLRRLVALSSRGLTLVAASRRDRDPASVVVDYALGADTDLVARGSALGELQSAPTAVGQTSQAVMTISGRSLDVHAVGVPPYPGRTSARILMLLEPRAGGARSDPKLTFVSGDIAAVDQDLPGVIIAHVVSDAARAWSRRGVAAALARAFPTTSAAFRAWSIADPENLRLGNIHHVDVHHGNQVITVVSMVAQAGYGPSDGPRLQYAALRQCLDRVATLATHREVEVHLPRIGAGQAGGRWDLIEADIVSVLADRGVPVTIYTLPSRTGGGPRT